MFSLEILLNNINLNRFLKSFYVGFSHYVTLFTSFLIINNVSSFSFFTAIIFFFKLFFLEKLNFYFMGIQVIFFNFLSLFMSKFYYVNDIVFHLFYITNLDLFLILNFIFLFVYSFLALSQGLLIPNFSQAKFEFLYNFIAQTAFSHNSWKGQRHFVFFIVLFLFILVSNFLGMVPFSFTVTSHIFQTFALGCGVIMSITFLAISKNGLAWFKFFFPSLPIFILPLFTCIEFVSYISRAFSLAIRLFANLMSGHTLLNILTGFILKIGSKGFISFIIALVPFFLISAIILLEMVIAVLQAYVFVTLVAIYLKDAYSTGH